MYYPRTVPGTFIERPNRFIAMCEIDGELEKCHVPNTSRLTELLIEGQDVILQASDNPNRKTKYSVINVKKNNIWINLDSQSPNQIVFEAIMETPEIIGIPKEDLRELRREVTYGSSRFDLYYESTNKKGYIEIKGVTLEEDSVATFPGAPTVRGQKHLQELMTAQKEGYDCGLFFCVQVPYVEEIRVHRQLDPIFGELYDQAKEVGVSIFAHRCSVTEEQVILADAIPYE